jgi:hypothetical protein
MGISDSSSAGKTSQEKLQTHKMFPYANQKCKWKDAIKSLIEADYEPESDTHEG